MIRLTRFCAAIILTSLAAGLSAESFSYSDTELRALLDASPFPPSVISLNDCIHEGQSLLEILPLMEEVDDFEIESTSGSRLYREAGLAGKWAESWLVPGVDGPGLIYDGILYRNLDEIQFTGTPMESRDLEIWLSWEGVDELKAELERFARAHNLDIHAIEVPRPDSKLTSVVRARGDVPDVVMIQSSAVDSLVRNRAIQGLGYLELPGLNPSGLDAFTLDNQLKAVPFYFDTQVFIANPDLVDLRRVPARPGWSLGELESLAGTVTGSGDYPMAWNAYSSNWLIPFQVSYGKDTLLDSDGGITVDDEPTALALEYVISLRDRGLLEALERDAMDALFIAGRIGIIMTGSYSIPYFESLGVAFEVLPNPVNHTTGHPVSPLLDYKGFCITRRANSPVLATRVIQYLSGAGVQQRFCMDLDKLPARTGVLDYPEAGESYLDVLREAARTGTVIPPQHVYSVYKNNMWKLLRFALSGRMSVQQTLEQGQRLMDSDN